MSKDTRVDVICTPLRCFALESLQVFSFLHNLPFSHLLFILFIRLKTSLILEFTVLIIFQHNLSKIFV